ncbi:MAG: cation transporter [Methylobacter sp.]|nr:cation transporter [Methylobacter sp.]
MTFKIIFFIFSLVTAPLLMQTIHAETVVQVKSNSQSVTLAIQNMTCAMCKFTIKKALLGVVGVQEVSVDYNSKTASVTFDPQKTSSEALIKATTDAGYPATVSQINK